MADDLDIIVQNPVTFSVTTQTQDFGFGVLLPSVASTAGSGGFSLTWSAATAPTMTSIHLPLNLAPSGVDIVSGDFVFRYSTPSPPPFPTLSVGEKVTLSTGTLAIVNFFSPTNPLNQMPVTPVNAAYLTNWSRGLISAATTTVPEPGSVSLVSLGAAFLIGKRRMTFAAGRV